MRLKFRLTGETYLVPKEVNDKLVLILVKHGYKVIDYSDNIISFKYHLPALLSQNRFRKIKKGEYEISVLNDKTNIKLTYYINILPEILFTILFVSIGIFTRDYECFGVVFIVGIIILINVIFQNEEANDIFEEI